MASIQSFYFKPPPRVNKVRRRRRRITYINSFLCRQQWNDNVEEAFEEKPTIWFWIIFWNSNGIFLLSMEGQFMFKISLLWDLYVCLSILNIYTIMMLGMCTQHWPFSYSSSSTPTILDREDIIVENNLFEIFCLNFMKCVKHMWQIPHDPKTRMSKRKKAAQFYSLRVWREKNHETAKGFSVSTKIYHFPPSF